MSKYTTEVRFICEQLNGQSESSGYDNVDTILANTHSKIFDFTYPIWDESYRPVLETKILKHFYTREIGEETVGLWKLRLNMKMNEIMPLFNDMYLTTSYEYDPFRNMDYNKDHDGESVTDGLNVRTDDLTKESETQYGGSDTSERSGQTVDNSNTWTLFSDTPQGRIDKIDLEEDAYLTNATHEYGDGGIVSTSGNDTTEYGRTVDGTVRDTGTSSTKKDATTTDEWLQHTVGYDYSKSGRMPAEIIMKWRESLINLDMMIIEQLEELFMQLW